MKLLVQPFMISNETIQDYLKSLFGVPHVLKIFNEGYEIRSDNLEFPLFSKMIRGLPKWSLEDFFSRLPKHENFIYMCLTNVPLINQDGKDVFGKGYNRRCVVSVSGGITRSRKPSDLVLISGMMEEIGHALGLVDQENKRRYHHLDSRISCVMQGHEDSNPLWKRAEDIQYCPACYGDILGIVPQQWLGLPNSLLAYQVLERDDDCVVLQTYRKNAGIYEKEPKNRVHMNYWHLYQTLNGKPEWIE